MDGIAGWGEETDFEALKPLIIIENEVIEFIGQAHAKEQISMFLEGDNFPNVLIIGEPGLGKTHLAKWVAGKLRKQPAIHRDLPIVKGDLDPNNRFVILDEVHMQKRPEWLYPYMEHSGWTFVGTTDQPENLPQAFMSRFIVQIRLRPYTGDDMQKMMNWYSDVPEEVSMKLAKASGGNPRQMKRIVATAEALGTFDPPIVLAAVRINADGITEDHLLYLDSISKFDRPVGLQYLSSTSKLDSRALKQLERMLMDKELIVLMPNGRRLTGKGRVYLDLMKERGLV